jgi:hypothetical protein
MAIRSHNGDIFGLAQAADEEPAVPIAIVTDGPCPEGYMRQGDACYPMSAPPGVEDAPGGNKFAPYALAAFAFFVGAFGKKYVIGIASALTAWYLANKAK